MNIAKEKYKIKISAKLLLIPSNPRTKAKAIK